MDEYFQWSLESKPGGTLQSLSEAAAIGASTDSVGQEYVIDVKVTRAVMTSKTKQPLVVTFGAIASNGEVEGPARQFLIYSRPLGRNFRILVTDNGIVMNECDGDSHFIQGKGLRPWLMVQNDDAPAVLHFRCLDNECTSTPPKPEAPPPAKRAKTE